MSETNSDAIHNAERLAALYNTDLLDSPPEAAFDRLTVLASKILHAPVILVSLIDEDHQFFKSTFGLPAPIETVRDLPLSHSICKHVVSSGDPLIVADARTHPLIHHNLAVVEMGAVAYAGIPLTTTEGHTLGSFCAIDMQPRQWSDEEIEILRDLAAFTLTEIKLRLIARQLHENLTRLQQLEALRDDLAHMLVHDLRTPLVSVLSGLQSMGFIGELNSDQQEFINISIDGGKTLLRMVNDLLDISKIESGKLQLDWQQVTADQLINAACQQVDSLAELNKLSVKKDVQSNIPAFTTDEDKIVRTLVNLLGNAIKFTPEGGTITLVANYSPDEDEFCFSICDSGEGIPPEAAEAIFEKFSQVESRKLGRQMSSGLGLTFCKLVVEAHGGRIWVQSTPGTGSTFRFTIPRRQNAPTETQ